MYGTPTAGHTLTGCDTSFLIEIGKRRQLQGVGENKPVSKFVVLAGSYIDTYVAVKINSPQIKMTPEAMVNQYKVI